MWRFFVLTEYEWCGDREVIAVGDDPNAYTAETFCPDCGSQNVEWAAARIYRCRNCRVKFDLNRELVNAK